MRVAPSAAEQTATWLTQMKDEIDAKRPDNVWFAAMFHPCLGPHGDAEACLRNFDARVAQHIFGRRWMNSPAQRQRPWAALVGQDGAEGFHFHGILAVPEEHEARFLPVADAARREVAPFGSLDLPALATIDDWIGYTTRKIRLGVSTCFVALPYVTDPSRLPFTRH
jgi:hypothetical protein